LNLEFLGDFEASCQNFEDFGVTSVCVYTEEAIPYTKKFVCDFSKKNYLQPFVALFDALGQNVTGNALNRDNFPTGNVVYLFQLAEPSTTDRLPYRSGPIRVEVNFKAGLDHSLELIILGTFPNYLSIDKRRLAEVVRT